jgi:hypothetical protein
MHPIRIYVVAFRYRIHFTQPFEAEARLNNI